MNKPGTFNLAEYYRKMAPCRSCGRPYLEHGYKSVCRAPGIESQYTGSVGLKQPVSPNA